MTRSPHRRLDRPSRPVPPPRRNVAVAARAAAAPRPAVAADLVVAPALAPPEGQAGVEQTYGTFAFQEGSKGWIVVTDAWAQDNLVVLRDVCGTGLAVQVHRLVAPLLEACLADAMRRCPAYRVRQLGGYAPRHKMNDPSRGLSIHAWGAAIDVNWDRNGVGANAPHDLPPDFVQAFTERGWDWGGGWRSSKDWMHFQYATGV